MMQKAYVRPTKSALIAGMIVVAAFLLLGIIMFFVLMQEGAYIGMVFMVFWVFIVLLIGGIYLYNYRNYDKNVEANVAGQIIIPSQTEKDDFADKLQKLDKLKKEGLISEAEFIKKRSEIMEQKW
jgi:predicted signal transduction protein with EAL and GGDEF domain